MKKQVIFFAAVFSLCLMNKANSQVVDAGTTGSCTWTLTGSSGNYTLTISGNGAMGDYVLSGITINTPWFSYIDDITTLNIQQGVTRIGDYAFAICTSLVGTLTIPNSVTTIGDFAVAECDGLTSVTIGNSVTIIGDYAFQYCTGLTSIAIPNSVTTIGNNAFVGCISLSTVNFNATNCTFMGGFDGTYVYPVFQGCSSFTTLNIGNNVQNIPEYAFQACSGLTSVTIPNSVTSIGGNAFRNCSGLTSITIPNSVTTIGYYAFRNCSGLTSVTIGNSVTSIGQSAFVSCINLSTVNFNATNCTFMGGFDGTYVYPVFQDCSSFTTLNIGNNVQNIPEYAFWDCTGLTSITIPNSVTTIGYYAFVNCSSLTSVTIGNAVTSIGGNTFANCTSLSTVNFNATNCTLMGDYDGTHVYTVFLNCPSFTTLNIGNNVQNIPEFAFMDCTGLTSVTIPNSVTTIESYAFYSCTGLTEMYIKAETPPTLGSGVFYDVSTTIPVYVPCGTATAYRNAPEWNYFTNIIEDIAVLSVQSNDNTMGTVNITRANTCTDNTAVIEAVANTGYRFVQWNDAITQNPRTVTVTQDVTYTATFAPVTQSTYHVTVNVNNPSMGTAIGSGDYAANSTATIGAIANAGYRFVRWNDGNTDNPRTITVTQDITYTAIFDNGVGITELETSAVALYPNPATDNIVISLREMITNAVFTLYDMQGRVLIRRNVSNEDVIPVSEFAAGVYIYNVSTAKGSINGKIRIN